MPSPESPDTMAVVPVGGIGLAASSAALLAYTGGKPATQVQPAGALYLYQLPLPQMPLLDTIARLPAGASAGQLRCRPRSHKKPSAWFQLSRIHTRGVNGHLPQLLQRYHAVGPCTHAA